MNILAWSLVGIGAFLLVYAALVLALVIAGRQESARALAGFIQTASSSVADCCATHACLAGRRRCSLRSQAISRCPSTWCRTSSRSLVNLTTW